MLQSEFEERYGKKVMPEYYAEVEEFYNECKLDKDAFVKEYKEMEHKEVFKAVRELLRYAKADVDGELEHNRKLESQIQTLKNDVGVRDEIKRQNDIEMGEWLIRTSFETRDEKMQETLRLKARCIMGMKTYLAYMIENKNLCWLVDDERKELLAYLNGER